MWKWTNGGSAQAVFLCLKNCFCLCNSEIRLQIWKFNTVQNARFRFYLRVFKDNGSTVLTSNSLCPTILIATVFLASFIVTFNIGSSFLFQNTKFRQNCLSWILFNFDGFTYFSRMQGCLFQANSVLNPTDAIVKNRPLYDDR